jgi:hypothetical protein
LTIYFALFSNKINMPVSMKMEKPISVLVCGKLPAARMIKSVGWWEKGLWAKLALAGP